MIGKIKGVLDEIDMNTGLIETSSGVYYRVYLTNRFLHSIQTPVDIEIYTYHHVREDTQQLFGFEDKKEYRLFEYLLGVPGVGPKSAFHIISVAKPDEIIQAVRENDCTFFSKIKGLGKKTALKILLELSQKFDSEFVFEPEIALSTDDQTVVDALVSLGFDKKASRDMLSEVVNESSIEDKIKLSIKRMSSS